MDPEIQVEIIKRQIRSALKQRLARERYQDITIIIFIVLAVVSAILLIIFGSLMGGAPHPKHPNVDSPYMRYMEATVVTGTLTAIFTFWLLFSLLFKWVSIGNQIAFLQDNFDNVEAIHPRAMHTKYRAFWVFGDYRIIRQLQEHQDELEIKLPGQPPRHGMSESERTAAAGVEDLRRDHHREEDDHQHHHDKR